MKISDSFKLWKIVRKVFGLIGATFAVRIELRLIYKHKYWKDNIKKTYAENSVPGSLASGGESVLSSSLSIFIFIAKINHCFFYKRKITGFGSLTTLWRSPSLEIICTTCTFTNWSNPTSRTTTNQTKSRPSYESPWYEHHRAAPRPRPCPSPMSGTYRTPCTWLVMW